MITSADVVVCGAGIAGVAAAYHLAVEQRVGRVVIVDEREPLTLTSDKGTQGYRNWWPGPDDTMLRFVSRSISFAVLLRVPFLPAFFTVVFMLSPCVSSSRNIVA